jgi:ribosomal protein L37E
MSRTIVTCKACGNYAVRYNHGTVCAHCGHGHAKLFDVKPQVPKGKIKVAAPNLDDKPLFAGKSTGTQTKLF